MTFLIIGASSQIAKELMGRLAEGGQDVVTISRSEVAGPSVAEHHTLDVSDFSQELPPIDRPLKGIVYLPGSMLLKPFNQLKVENFQHDLHLNFLSAVRCLEKYLPLLEKQDTASIVLMSTVAVQLGLSYHTTISAAKGAVEGFSRALAAELAPKIRVNCIAPSILDTPLAKPILDRPAQKELSEKRHPLHRIGQAKDVASMIHFLLTEGTWITGQVLHVDGGLSSLRLF